MKNSKRAYRAALLAAMLMAMLSAGQALAISRMPSDDDTGGWWGNSMGLFHAPYHRILEARAWVASRVTNLRSSLRLPADPQGGGFGLYSGNGGQKRPQGVISAD